MRNLRWILPLACAAWLGACATEPAKPGTLTIVSGDSQFGLEGTVLAESLVVTVNSADGAPLAGANLTWQATAGAAAVSPLPSVSDGSGRAAVAVSLASAGPGTVTATADGLPPMTFQVTSVGTCDWRIPIGFTSTTNAALNFNDCTYQDGSFIEYYSMVTAAQQAVRIRLASASFDTFLFLNDVNGVPVADNDDDANGTNSEIQIILAPGSYVVGANAVSPGDNGPYTLTTQSLAGDIVACGLWYVTPGVVTSQQLSATDCVSGGFYSDEAVVYLRAGRAYTFTENSTAFDAFLELQDANGSVVASDDNSGGLNNARFVYTPQVSDIYFVVAGSHLANAVGAYTLSVSAPVPAGPVGPSSVAVVRRPRLSWPGWSASARRRPAGTQP